MSNQYVFPSGLRLVINKIDTARSVSVGVFVAAGAGYENEFNNGLSHFVEHMLFKGTTSRSAFQIVEEVESLGVKINAFTSKTITAYYTSSLDSHLEKCVEILSDIYYNSVFNKDEMNKERSVILEEIQMGEEDPYELCLDNIATAFYGYKGPGQNILGTKKKIEAYTPLDIKKYFNEEYIPAQTVVSIAGNIDESITYNLVYDYFERFAKKGTVAKQKQNNETPSFEEIVIDKPNEQSHIAIAFPGLDIFDVDYNALKMASNLFGGGMSSRLFQSVREDLGLAYNIFSSTSAYLYSGVFIIYLATNLNTVEQSVEAVKKEINKVVDLGFNEGEFLKAKEQFKTSLALRMESTHSIMLSAGSNLLIKNSLFRFEDELSDIDAVSLTNVNEVIKGVFSKQDCAVSYVGKKLGNNVKILLNQE